MSERHIRCRIGDVVRRGVAIDVHQSIPPSRVAAAVLTEASDPDAQVSVTSPDPPPLYEHVGCLRPEMGLRTRTALARAARTLGRSTPYDDELSAARESLADLAATDEHGPDGRQSVAAAETETERLRERVATARGRLIARRENGLDTTPAAEALADAITDLSEAETREAAARQSLERDRESRRARRDRQERRFRLEDRVANLERKARATLVDEVRERYEDALETLPGAVHGDDPLAVDPIPAALAIVRIAATPAPVVVALDRFDSARAAHEWLDAPVLHV